MPINFIRFVVAPTVAGFVGGSGALAAPVQDFYRMPMRPGDQIKFIFTTSENLNLTTLKAAWLNEDLSLAVDDVAVVTAGKYWVVSVPPSVAQGCYRLLLYGNVLSVSDWTTVSVACEQVNGANTGYLLTNQERIIGATSTKKALFVSNVFQHAVHRSGVVMAFRGHQNGWGFDYQSNPGFYQQFRIEVAISRAQYPDIKKVYRQSNGVYRHANVSVDKKVTLDTEYFDEDTHDALANALKHDEFILDGIPYFSEGEYEPEWIETGNTDNRYHELSKAATELFIQGYNQRNNVCGGVDLNTPLILGDYSSLDYSEEYS